MKSIVGVIVAMAGALFGAIGGFICGGYFFLYKSLEFLTTTPHDNMLLKLVIGICMFFLTKMIVGFSTIIGMLIGSLPGFYIFLHSED